MQTMNVKNDHRSNGFNGIRTHDLREYLCDALPNELWSHTLGAWSVYWVHVFYDGNMNTPISRRNLSRKTFPSTNASKPNLYHYGKKEHHNLVLRAFSSFLKSGAGPGDRVVGSKLHNNAVLCKMVIQFEFKFYFISARKLWVWATKSTTWFVRIAFC